MHHGSAARVEGDCIDAPEPLIARCRQMRLIDAPDHLLASIDMIVGLALVEAFCRLAMSAIRIFRALIYS